MRVLSVNVATPRTYSSRGHETLTGIYKSPVEDARHFDFRAVEGDLVADLSVHGGTHKAAYLYPGEHYAYWRERLPGQDLAHGYFGENLTTEGLTEETVCIGDRLTLGEAEFIASEPRFPCATLAARVGDPAFAKRFTDSGRSGIYLFVARPGRIQAGDAIVRGARDPRAVPVAEFVRVYAHAKAAHHDDRDIDIVRRLLQTEILGAQWRERFTQRLADLTGGTA